MEDMFSAMDVIEGARSVFVDGEQIAKAELMTRLKGASRHKRSNWSYPRRHSVDWLGGSWQLLLQVPGILGSCHAQGLERCQQQ